ncbi:MAG: cytochrome oxidase [Acidobacteria bacterium]|nr:cytochrome oxidase [Acidobacteriota bacterium]
MDILIVTLFVSLLLGLAGLFLFVLRLRAGDFEHADRLSLLPLDNDEPVDSPDRQPTRAPSDSGS